MCTSELISNFQSLELFEEDRARFVRVEELAKRHDAEVDMVELVESSLSQSWSLTLPLQNVDDDPLVDAINTMLTFNASVTNAVE